MVSRFGVYSRSWVAGLLAGVSVFALVQAGPAIARDDTGAARDLAALDSAIEIAQGEPTYLFDIVSKPLPEAMVDFSAVTGLEVLYTEPAPFGQIAPALEGTLTADQALDRLTAGSGLRYRFTNNTTVTLERSTAQDEDEPIRLGPVTVTASRFERPARELPRTIFVLDEAEREKQPTFDRNVQEGLGKTVPGATITEPFGSDTRLRGREASFRINGVEINRQTFGSDVALQNFPGGAFGSIGVTLGADATFGFGAPGGVIDFGTREAQPGPLGFESDVAFQFQPTDVGESISPILRQSAYGSLGEDTEFRIDLGAKFFGTLFDPDGDPLPDDDVFPFANSDNYHFSGHLAHQLDADQTVETKQFLSYSKRDPKFSVISDGDIASRTKAVVGDFAPNPLAGQNFRDPREILYVGTVTYSHNDIFGSRFEGTAYVSRQDGRAPVIAGDEEFGRLREVDTNIGLRTSIETPLTVLHRWVPGSTVTWGLDFERNNFESDSEENSLGGVVADRPFIPSQEDNRIAGFAQLEVPVGSQVTLLGGLRYEHQWSELESVAERDDGRSFEGGDFDFGQVLFNVGVVYEIDEQMETFFNFSQAAVSTDLGRGSFLFTSAKNLRPEPSVIDQYEVGIRGTWSDVQAQFSAFYSESKLGQRFEDIGFGVGTPRREPVQIWGMEAAVDWQANEMLRVGGSASWSDGKREVDGNTTRLGGDEIVPGKFGGFVEVTPVDWALGRIDVVHVLRADATSQVAAVDNMTFVDAHASFDVGPGQLAIGMENILNLTNFNPNAQAAEEFESFVPFRGRSVTVRYRVTW